MARKYFAIDGYWKDDKAPFGGYNVASTDFDEVEDENIGDSIFFYGLTEGEIKEAIALGEEYEEDFVILNYTEIFL